MGHILREKRQFSQVGYLEDICSLPCPTRNVGNLQTFYVLRYSWMKEVAHLVSPHPVLEIDPDEEIDE